MANVEAFFQKIIQIYFTQGKSRLTKKCGQMTERLNIIDRLWEVNSSSMDFGFGRYGLGLMHDGQAGQWVKVHFGESGDGSFVFVEVPSFMFNPY